MKLYGIKVKFYFEELDGCSTTVLRNLHKTIPSDEEVKSLVEKWLIGYQSAYDNKQVLCMVDRNSVKTTVIDFDLNE